MTERLRANGVRIVERDQIDSIQTEAVMITAHGSSDATKDDLATRGSGLRCLVPIGNSTAQISPDAGT